MPALLHTAEIHRATFDAMAPEAELTHVVRPDLLSRAQGGIDAALEAEIAAAVRAAGAPCLCTCTTIGEVAQAAGAIRIDWPMMQEAARFGGPVIMAYALDSTLEPSRALLQRAFAEAGQALKLTLLPLTDLWPLFDTDPHDAFGRAIAARVDAALDQTPASCVVLAQASMAPAADFVTTSVPVLSSPRLALKTLLGER